MTSFWSRLKEVFYNFTQPIQDVNMGQIDITDKEFETIALANGVSVEALQELKRNREGINLNTSNTKNKISKELTNIKEEKKEKSRKTQSKNDIEMER